MSDKPCFVYLIAHTGPNGPEAPIKVGISRSPDSRLAGFQTASYRRLEGVVTFHCNTREVAMSVERTFHDLNSDFRLNGEWFDIDPVSAIHLLMAQIRLQFDASGWSYVALSGDDGRRGFGDAGTRVIRRLMALRKRGQA